MKLTLEKAVKIDEIIDSIRHIDLETANDFDMIYEAYKDVFDRVSWP